MNKVIEAPKHQNWVDIVKGVAILAVVVWHTTYDLSVTGWGGVRAAFGTMWHVPVFLMVGGFFLKDDELRNPKKFIKKKWNTLYVRLLIYYGVFIILHNFFFKVGLLSADELYNGKHIYPLVSVTDYIKQIGWAFVAAREPFLGAMWFVNLLFLGLCLLSIITWAVSKYVPKEKYEYVRALAVVLVSFFSFVLSHVCGISITRITPALTAVILIYLGFLINRIMKIKFDNFYIFLGASIVVLDIILTWKRDVSMASDAYLDLIFLCLGTCSMLYILCYIAKHIENTWIGKFFTLCGRESYDIMAFHLLGFKVATFAFCAIGISKPLATLHSPANNVWELGVYVGCSLSFCFCISSVINKLHK